jgi:diaminohydroxyphosphoribosylaminopyrimidine deaminase/5-amino-6-(5-phosphoribosylamino)uracil reductase
MSAVDETQAWALLLALARAARAGRSWTSDVGLRLGDGDTLVETSGDDAWIVARPALPRGWSWPRSHGGGSVAAEQLFDLYMPLCVGARDWVLAHLGQSLDGRIATRSGVSQFITGNENQIHAHRLRALCDVVLVGSRTVLEDDPQLTTRHVPGPNPVRAVIDSRRRLALKHRLFHDGVAPTLLLCARETSRGATQHGQAEVVGVEATEGQLSIAALLAELRRRGLRRVFIEGGGVTISRFLQARALTRLQVAVAPMLLGSGRPSFALPVIETLADAVMLECRHFITGRDVLFDCVLAPERE